jgi:hypothetical protein
MSRKKHPIQGSLYATQELIKRERFVGQVYDPARRDNGIIDTFILNGNPLFMTSCDFLEHDGLFSNIITEPDPDVAVVWANRALYLAFNKVAFLLPARFIETEQAKDLFDKTPLVRVYILTKHLPFRRGASAWFVWEKGNFASPKIGWI